MRRLTCLAALLAAATLVLAADAAGRSETNPDKSKSKDKQSKPTIVGTWLTRSVSISLDGKSRKNLPKVVRSGRKSTPLKAFVSEKKFTLRVGEKVLADMTYALDPKQDPGAIDLKSPDGLLLGIYKLSGNRLKIRLDDASRGRPKNFNRNSRGLDFDFRQETVANRRKKRP